MIPVKGNPFWIRLGHIIRVQRALEHQRQADDPQELRRRGPVIVKPAHPRRDPLQHRRRQRADQPVKLILPVAGQNPHMRGHRIVHLEERCGTADQPMLPGNLAQERLVKCSEPPRQETHPLVTVPFAAGGVVAPDGRPHDGGRHLLLQRTILGLQQRLPDGPVDAPAENAQEPGRGLGPFQARGIMDPLNIKNSRGKTEFFSQRKRREGEKFPVTAHRQMTPLPQEPRLRLAPADTGRQFELLDQPQQVGVTTA